MRCVEEESVDSAYGAQPSVNGYENALTIWQNDRQRWAYDVNAFIGYELTLVPAVENVFVSKEDEDGRSLRVTVVVNVRDPQTRAAIYKREQAIMDELKHLEFDFHIIAREGRPLSQLITDAGAGDSAL